MAGLRRIYVDNRERNSGSLSDFEISLPQSYEIPRETVAVIDSVFLPSVWHTIEAGVNDRLYVVETSTAHGIQKRTSSLPHGNYGGVDLATMLASNLNGGTTMGNNA